MWHNAFGLQASRGTNGEHYAAQTFAKITEDVPDGTEAGPEGSDLERRTSNESAQLHRNTTRYVKLTFIQSFLATFRDSDDSHGNGSSRVASARGPIWRPIAAGGAILLVLIALTYTTLDTTGACPAAVQHLAAIHLRLVPTPDQPAIPTFSN